MKSIKYILLGLFTAATLLFMAGSFFPYVKLPGEEQNLFAFLPLPIGIAMLTLAAGACALFALSLRKPLWCLGAALLMLGAGAFLALGPNVVAVLKGLTGYLLVGGFSLGHGYALMSIAATTCLILCLLRFILHIAESLLFPQIKKCACPYNKRHG